MDSQEHYVTAMAALGGTVVLACRCGLLVRSTYVTEAQQQWATHLEAARSE